MMNKKDYTLLGVAILSFAIVLISSFLLLFLSEDEEFVSENPFFSTQYIAEKSNNLASDITPLETIPTGNDVNPKKQGEIVLDEKRKVANFDMELTESEKDDIERKYTVEFTDDVSVNGVYSIITTDKSDLEGLQQSLGSIETDIPVRISADTVDWGISRIGADKVWEKSTGSGVTVAIIDTGIQLDHPDLQANVVSGYDFVNSRTNASDDHGHGTHVAGIVAAVQNQAGIVGASHRSKLMPVKVLNSTGSGYVSDVAKGIYWAADNGAQIINMSLGTTTDSDTLRKAVNYAASKGVLMVGAAGNDSGSPCSYPGAYGGVICVVATDSSNRLASFSNVGGELAAPGVSNYSTFLGGTYRYLSGTSMASPHVAGSLAVVRQACPTCTSTQLRDTLRDTAVDLGEEGYDIIFGYGLVDLVGAIDLLLPEEELQEQPVETPEQEEEKTEEEEKETVTEKPQRPTAPTKKGFDRQIPVITKPEKDVAGRITMNSVEDIEVEFKLEPVTTNSGLEKMVVSLNNEPVYTTTQSNDKYTILYDDFDGIQQFVRVSAFFSDGTQAHDQVILDRSNLMNLRKPSNNIIQRGRRVLGISSGFSLLNILDLFRF